MRSLLHGQFSVGQSDSRTGGRGEEEEEEEKEEDGRVTSGKLLEETIIHSSAE